MGKLTDHFKSNLPKVINKQIFVMGDFNINLLNFDSHSPTTEFVNNLFSCNFLPCLNHPAAVLYLNICKCLLFFFALMLL